MTARFDALGSAPDFVTVEVIVEHLERSFMRVAIASQTVT
jgi:hypothetical protein